jgi:hypothetical protein
MWVGRSHWGDGDAYLNADLAGLLVVDQLLAPAAADAAVARMMHGKEEVCVTLWRVAIWSHLSEHLFVALLKPHVPLRASVCALFVCAAWFACVHTHQRKYRRIVHLQVNLMLQQSSI